MYCRRVSYFQYCGTKFLNERVQYQNVPQNYVVDYVVLCISSSLKELHHVVPGPPKHMK